MNPEDYATREDWLRALIALADEALNREGGEPHE